MRFHYVVLTLGLLISFSVFALENDRFQDMEIRFSNNKLTVQQAFNELNQLPGISVVYNSNKDFLLLTLSLPESAIKIVDALAIIKKQAPVEIVFNNNHIIVKSRELQQYYKLTGKVLDAETREGLIAADVYLAGTTRGTVTDVEGNFSFTLSPGSYSMVVRYVGYSEKRIEVSLYSDQETEIYLVQKKHEIQEVNVTGTRSEVEELTRGRPIEKIDGKTIEQLNTNDVNDALHGRLNGVWTTKVSGAPGDHNKVRIRGISSIFGSTDPLYVVDGMLIPVVDFKTLGIADLNSHDIQSITVLKDASSTALYGYLGGNGVILVETKRGGGEPKFEFNYKKGIQTFDKRYDLLNTREFLTNLELSDRLAGSQFYTINEQFHKYELYPYYADSLGNTNFQNELFQLGNIDDYNLSGQGTYHGIDYYISGGYYSHEGVVINSAYTKYTLTTNLAKRVGEKLSIRLLYKGSKQLNRNNLDNYQGNDVIFRGINYEPGYYFTPDSFLRKAERMNLVNDYSHIYGSTLDQLSNTSNSSEQLLHEQKKEKEDFAHSGNLEGIYQVNKYLMFQARFSLASKNFIYTSFIPGSGSLQKPRYLKSDEHILILNHEYNLGYERAFQKHKISGFLQSRNYYDNIYWQIDSLLNIEIDGLSVSENVYMRGSSAIYGQNGSVIRSLNALIGNINYSYMNKYSVSFFANYDRLKEGIFVDAKQWFTSLALDYDLAHENFLLNQDWLNAFHLYINYGQSGNFPLNSMSNDLYAPSSEVTVNDTARTGVVLSNLANHYIKYEKVTEYNIGSEIAMFDRRLVISGDYFLKFNSNLLVQREIPYYYGGGFYYQNIGEMKNNGLELSLEITPIETPNASWTTRFGFSSNKQILTQLYDTLPISFNDEDILYPDFYAEENEVLGAITGYQCDGLWNDDLHAEELYGYPRYINYDGLAILNADSSDNRINQNDKLEIGYSIPKYTFNWINQIQYRNFTVDMLWYGVIGIDKYNATKATTFISGVNREVQHIVQDTMRYHRSGVFYESSYFVEDASFMRLKTLTLRYAPPKKLFSRVSMEFALSFENLITLTHYSGYDPEATIYTSNNFSDNAIDKGSYPNPRGYYLSINLTF